MTSEQLRVIRSKVGTVVDFALISAAWEEWESVPRVVLEILEGLLSKMLQSPASVSIDGALSISYGENIRSLRESIAWARRELAMDPETGLSTSVLKMVRQQSR